MISFIVSSAIDYSLYFGARCENLDKWHWFSGGHAFAQLPGRAGYAPEVKGTMLPTFLLEEQGGRQDSPDQRSTSERIPPVART